MGSSEVRLLDISRRGVLLETQSRLKFGVKATIRFTMTDASVSVGALVVRSRVSSLNESVVYHTALAFDQELCLADSLADQQSLAEEHEAGAAADAPASSTSTADHNPMSNAAPSEDDEAHDPFALDNAHALNLEFDFENKHVAVEALSEEVSADGEISLNETLSLLVTVSHDLEELQRRADAHHGR